VIKLRDTGKIEKKKGLIFTKTSYLYCTIITVSTKLDDNLEKNQQFQHLFLKILGKKDTKHQQNKKHKQKTTSHFLLLHTRLKKQFFLRIIFSGPHNFFVLHT